MATLPLMLAAMAARTGAGALRGAAQRTRDNRTRKASINSQTLQQRMREDQRQDRLRLSRGLLEGVPETTAGGGVRTNTRLDPALWDELMRARDYNFGPTVPRPGGGAAQDFLAGLLEGGADLIPEMPIPGASTPQAGAAAAGTVNPPSNAQGALSGGTPTTTVQLEDLLRLLGIGVGAQPPTGD